ncbi:MAG: nucleotidyltransferase domain-containing protein [Bacteroidota bacterium]|nr:nucleotidyltransferase domain-containing protein [Bacteroidota bacterium]
MFGLKDSDILAIREILSRYPEVEHAYVFGSRVKGNYRNGSDVDIALKGETLIYSIVSTISFSLNEETIMPYHFDVLNYHTIRNEQLTEHIDRVGVCFYTRAGN